MRCFKNLVEAFFTFLDWVVYLSLLGISVSIAWEVMEKFHSKATNIRQYEEPITMRPTITFCFSGIDGTGWQYWRYEEDFIITYRINYPLPVHSQVLFIIIDSLLLLCILHCV